MMDKFLPVVWFDPQLGLDIWDVIEQTINYAAKNVCVVMFRVNGVLLQAEPDSFPESIHKRYKNEGIK